MHEKDRKKINKFFKEKFGNIKFDTDESRVLSYSSVKDEYEAISKGAGVYLNSSASFLELKGNDVLDFVHRISTNSASELGVLENVTTLFTNEKGRIIDRTVLLNLDGFYLLIGNQAAEDSLRSWLERYIISEDIKIDAADGQYMLLEIIGPQAESYLTIFCGNCLSGLIENKIFEIDYEGIKIYVMKFIGPNRKAKFWVIGESHNAHSLLSKLIDNKSVFDMHLLGEDVWELYRISNSIPKSPNELNDSFNPHELNLIDEVDFKKGCYIGQEVIARLDTYDKVQRYLRRIEFGDEIKPGEEYQLLDENGSDAGIITSILKSELNGKFIGLALVRKKFCDAELKLHTIDMHGKTVPVRLID